MTKTIIITSITTAVLIVALLFGLSLVVGHNSQSFGTQVQNDVFTFVNGINAGLTNTNVINSSAQWVGPVNTTSYVTSTGGMTESGAASFTGSFTLSSASSTSFDPASFSSTTVASTSLSVAGLVAGDRVLATFDSVTSTEQWYVVGRVLSTGNAVVNFLAIPGTAAWNAGLNLTTSTLRVMVIHK